MRVEVGGHVAARAGEDRSGRAPRGRVGVLARDVLGDLVAREEPDRDAVRVPEVGEDASAGLVEARAIRARVLLRVRAARVRASRARALGTHNVRGRVRGVVQRATRAGVEGDLVVGVEVHALDDVDLAGVGPVRRGTHSPVRGPGATAERHLGEVGDEEARAVRLG